jgi:dTDP-glucose 4,6-dehydratase
LRSATPGDPQIIRADIGSYRQLEQLLAQTGEVDYVYRLAAEFGRLNGEAYYQTLWSINVIGTRHILELQRQHQFKLIFASSSEIYGDRHEEILHQGYAEYGCKAQLHTRCDDSPLHGGA